jgi:hypothetical protein
MAKNDGGRMSAAKLHPHPAILPSELPAPAPQVNRLASGTRIKVLPLRNDAGLIIPDYFGLTGQQGSVAAHKGDVILVRLDSGYSGRLDSDRVAVVRR